MEIMGSFRIGRLSFMASECFQDGGKFVLFGTLLRSLSRDHSASVMRGGWLVMPGTAGLFAISHGFSDEGSGDSKDIFMQKCFSQC
jgi:hypothetical protein